MTTEKDKVGIGGMDFRSGDEIIIDALTHKVEQLELITKQLCEVILWQVDCPWQEPYDPIREYVKERK